MGSVNRVTLVGRLGADPELKYSGAGKAICNLRIATSETWKDKTGTKQEKTEWHRCTLFGDQAENASKYLAKGREVYVEGRLETTSYEKDGIKRFSTSVIADRVVFLHEAEVVFFGPPQEMIKSDIARTSRVIRDAHITGE